MKSLYFRNLNGVRFIAAAMVMLHHFNYNSKLFDSIFYLNFVEKIGKLGVVLFFTLSGFLITYLLLLEKETQSDINIKSFYIRRILRIWPLYFFIVLLSLFVLNEVIYFQIPGLSASINSHFYQKIVLYVFMLPNVAYAFGYNLPYADQCWSIGVEEQFYLFWPLLLKKFKNPLYPIIAVIITYLIIKTLFIIFNNYNHYSYFEKVFYLIFVSNFSTMAIGGLAALALFKKSILLKFIQYKAIQVLIFTLAIVFTLLGVNFSYFNFEIYAIVFALIILILTNSSSILSLEVQPLIYLGKISFGLYMYHNMAIRIADLISFRIQYLKTSTISKNFLMFTITFFLASISYNFFEKWFIKRKLYYSVIISGDNINTKLNAS